MKNKLKKIILVSGILIVIFVIAIIYIVGLNNNKKILLKLTENIVWTNSINENTNKKVYVSVYDGKETKKYESSSCKNLSNCLKNVNRKIFANLSKISVRLDITSDDNKNNNILDIANDKNTISYYYENDNVYNLTKYEIGKARDIRTIDIKNDVLNKTYNYMLNQIKSNGIFVYGINLDTGQLSNDYNIIRHIGSIWSLLDYYNYNNQNEKDLNKIKNAYDYIYNNNLKKKDNETDFIFTEKSKCKIGSNALMILASNEMYNITGDKKYLDNSIKLANGIIYLQDKDGSFYHIINSSFNKSGKNSNIIYSGEINFALIRLYELTKDERYLKSVLKSMDYFIKEKNVNTNNQWFAYFYVELIKHVKDYKYMSNFINDMEKNLNKIDTTFSRCDMEFLGNSYTYLDELITNYNEYNLKKYISKDKLNDLLEHVKKTYVKRAQKGLSNFATIENSMYLYDTNSINGAFFEKDYFARIDVSQHNLSGFKMFYEYLYDDNKLNYNDFGEIDDKTKNNTQSFNNDLEEAYVNLARQAVETYVSTGETISVPDNLPNELYENCKNGVYVGIHNNDELRGCRGSFKPNGSNAEEVIKYAINAASNDSRFSPVEVNELNDLIYEVSVLTDPIKVKSKKELDVNKYGIIIEKGNKRGTMLPNRSTISTVDEQIKKTLKKAGLKEDEKDYDLYKFETISYKG